MANLKDVIYLSNEDYETLISTGTVTIDGTTLTYDENNVYITPDKLASTTEDGLMSASDKTKIDSLPTFGTAATKNFTTSVTSGSNDLVTSGAVYTAIDNLPEPMLYKGTLGTGGTITDLSAASSENEGFTYKVITDGTYASQSAKVGDVFISNGSAWTLVPAGDDVEDTWRQINVNGTQLLGTGISTGAVNFKNGSNITITGSGNDITISASQPTVNNGTLTIQKNGTTVNTFTANQSSNVTANITVPTKVTDLSDASNYINTGDTAQAKSGALSLTGNVYIGDGTNSVRAVDDAPYQTKFLNFDRRTGVLKHFNVFSGVGDHLYNADKRSNCTIRTTFKGNGTSDDVYKADFYTYGVDETGSYPSYLFDWDLNSGWQVLPSKVSASTPAIIEVKCTSRFNYTDVLRLVLTGHNGYDGGNHYSGTLTNYTIEVCTDYTNDTWVTVVNRSNVTDKIGLCPQYALQTSNYTPCFGIRLTITGCSVTGTGYAYIKITSMQLRNHRPDFTVPESIGALSLRGGTIYGDILMGSNTGNSIRPTTNNKGNVGTSSYQFNNIYGKIIYENGTSLSNKYTSLASDQTISGTKTFSVSPVLNNNIALRSKNTNGESKRLIALNAQDNAVVNWDNVGGTYIGGSVISPLIGNSGVSTLGDSTHLWKDLYLSGNLTDGTNSITIANIQNKLPTTTTAGKVLKSTSTAGTVAWGDTELAEEVTWSSLKSKRDNSQLMPGKFYRITDYTCTTTTINTSSAGHVFDIVVRADNVNKLNETAYAIQHAEDTYFSNSKLEAWELKYCLDNSTSRFAWADTTNGKGVIYFLKDEFSNELSYDFKNILFSKPYTIIFRHPGPGLQYMTRYPSSDANNYFAWKSQYFTYFTSSVTPVVGDTLYSNTLGTSSGFTIQSVDSGYSPRYTFNIRTNSNSDADDSLLGKCYNNIIKGYYVNKILNLNKTLFNYNFNQNSVHSNYIAEDNHDNLIGASFYNNTIGLNFYNNTIGSNFHYNTIEIGFYNNTISNSFHSNIIGPQFTSNNIGESFSSNTIGSDFYNNTIGSDFRRNTIGYSFSMNTINSLFQYNIIGPCLHSNTIGSNFEYNNIGANFSESYIDYNFTRNTIGPNFAGNNHIGSNFVNNIIGSNFVQNIIGSYFSESTIGHDFSNNNIGSSASENVYVRYCKFDDGISYTVLTSTDTSASASNYLQNVHVHLGVQGTSSSYKTITIPDRNLSYETAVYPIGVTEMFI